MKCWRWLTVFGAGVVLVLATVRTAQAVPVLQLYIEGAEYDTEIESWVFLLPSNSEEATFRLWALGNVDGPGGHGAIKEVRLAVAYETEWADKLGFSFTSSSTQGTDYAFFTDTSVPGVPATKGATKTSMGTVYSSKGYTGAPDDMRLFGNGGTPVLGDGRNLAPHGIFGDGMVWREYHLGDFDQIDSPVGDFTGSFPTELTPDSGQLNVYDVTIRSPIPISSGTNVYFDLDSHIEGNAKNRAGFAPSTHGLAVRVTFVPEPAASVIWLLTTAAAAAGIAWRRRTGGQVG